MLQLPQPQECKRKYVQQLIFKVDITVQQNVSDDHLQKTVRMHVYRIDENIFKINA